MSGTYTEKWGLYLPDVDSIGWGDIVNANFQIISEHMGGRLNELADVNISSVPQSGDSIRYNHLTEQWENCRNNQVGIQTHSELQGLDSDSHGIYLLLDGSLPMSNNIDLNYHKIINSRDPELPGDLVTKRYIDTINLSLSHSDSAISKSINDPSTILVHTEGDMYIIGPNPVDAWSGRAGDLAIWINGGWQYPSYREGRTIYVIDEHTYYNYTGTEWVYHFTTLNHHDVANHDAYDDHPQYLNINRHRRLSEHVLGVTVPFGNLSTLEDVSINPTSLADKDVLVYVLPDGAPAGTGRWQSAASNTVGHQTHNALGDRFDLNSSGEPIYDPESSNYDKNGKCHPQYLTFTEHAFDDHNYLSSKYIPWSPLVGFSLNVPDGIKLGDQIQLKRVGDAGKLTITTSTQTVDNTVTFPNTSGAVVVSSTTPPNGTILMSDGTGRYIPIPSPSSASILKHGGTGTTPEWITFSDAGLVNADWLATSGPSQILNKPREFIFVTAYEPENPVKGDIWIDTST